MTVYLCIDSHITVDLFPGLGSILTASNILSLEF